jgi:hypothetical protein
MELQLSQVDAELVEIERQLAQAQAKRESLAREKEIAAEAARKARAPTLLSSLQRSPSRESSDCVYNADELQRRIDELQRELAKDERAKQTLPPTQPTRRSTILIDNEDTCIHDSSPKKPQRRSTREIPKHSIPDLETKKEEQEEEKSTTRPKKQQQQRSYEPTPDPIRATTQQKYSFEKPDWAIPMSSIPDNSVIKDSIQNNLKKPNNNNGYERKVFEKNDLEIIRGTFVQHVEKIPDPRLVWIVININGSKAGKIVMHLYGNFIAIVDQFLQLKGLEIKREQRCGKQTVLVVNDINPVFYIHSGKPNNFTTAGNPQTDVFGVVQEGHEIVNQMLNHPEPDAVFTIKQSHIYPVKKSRF